MTVKSGKVKVESKRVNSGIRVEGAGAGVFLFIFHFTL